MANLVLTRNKIRQACQSIDQFKVRPSVTNGLVPCPTYVGVKMFKRRIGGRFAAGRGFTLVELLVTMAVIVILASLLLPVISKAKGLANSVTCKNHLRQMGMALAMYVNDSQNRYPYAYDPGNSGDNGNYNAVEYNFFWFSKLTPYYQLQWTNAAYHCPGYKGPIIGILNEGTNKSGPQGSYGYNMRGVRGSYSHYSDPVAGPRVNYGLGPTVRAVVRPAIAEAAVKAPSEMFAIGETRFLSLSTNGGGGGWFMNCGSLHSNSAAFDPARHGKNYNTVCCDGHVAGMDPWILFNPADTAPMWNYDHLPRPELWTP